MYITIEKYTIPQGNTRYRVKDTTLLAKKTSILIRSEKSREVIDNVTHLTQTNYWTSENDWREFIEQWQNHPERPKSIAHMRANGVTKVVTNDQGTILRQHLG